MFTVSFWSAIVDEYSTQRFREHGGHAEKLKLDHDLMSTVFTVLTAEASIR
jgi:hypothetical protein